MSIIAILLALCQISSRAESLIILSYDPFQRAISLQNNSQTYWIVEGETVQLFNLSQRPVQVDNQSPVQGKYNPDRVLVSSIQDSNSSKRHLIFIDGSFHVYSQEYGLNLLQGVPSGHQSSLPIPFDSDRFLFVPWYFPGNERSASDNRISASDNQTITSDNRTIPLVILGQIEGKAEFKELGKISIKSSDLQGWRSLYGFVYNGYSYFCGYRSFNSTGDVFLARISQSSGLNSYSEVFLERSTNLTDVFTISFTILNGFKPEPYLFMSLSRDNIRVYDLRKLNQALDAIETCSSQYSPSNGSETMVTMELTSDGRLTTSNLTNCEGSDSNETWVIVDIPQNDLQHFALFSVAYPQQALILITVEGKRIYRCILTVITQTSNCWEIGQLSFEIISSITDLHHGLINYYSKEIETHVTVDILSCLIFETCVTCDLFGSALGCEYAQFECQKEKRQSTLLGLPSNSVRASSCFEILDFSPKQLIEYEKLGINVTLSGFNLTGQDEYQVHVGEMVCSDVLVKERLISCQIEGKLVPGEWRLQVTIADGGHPLSGRPLTTVSRERLKIVGTYLAVQGVSDRPTFTLIVPGNATLKPPAPSEMSVLMSLLWIGIYLLLVVACLIFLWLCYTRRNSGKTDDQKRRFSEASDSSAEDKPEPKEDDETAGSKLKGKGASLSDF